MSADPPDAPTSLRIIGISEDSISIEWSAPKADGGAPITGYVVEKCEGHSSVWSHVASVSSTTTSYVVTGLSSNSSYYLRVAAENEEGRGSNRELTEAVRPMKPKSEHLPLSLDTSDVLGDYGVIDTQLNVLECKCYMYKQI